MIPKKIHYVWFGKHDFGETEKRCLESWKKVLPEYELVRWDDSCIQKFDNRYFREAIETHSYAFASDYVRLWALYHEGGIYMDTDEEVLKPLDEFLAHDYFMGCQSCGTAKTLNPALIGAVPQHPIVKDLLSVYDDMPFINADGSYNRRTNPEYFCEVLTKKYHLSSTYVTKGCIEFAPRAFVYDYKHFGTDNRLAYAVHHYSGSWMPDWKVKDVFKLKIGKGIFILRKYKQRRDVPMPSLAAGEKEKFRLRTSRRSTLMAIYQSL